MTRQFRDSERRRLSWACSLALAQLWPAAGCSPGGVHQTDRPASAAPWLLETTRQADLTFRHDPGDLSEYELPQITGSGAAWLDYDSDGRIDLFLVEYGPDDALYRQQPDGRLDPVTAAAGLDGTGAGMGTAVGDLDNDGFADLLVTGYGSVRLWKNNGDGTLADVTEAAGLVDPGWSTAACFCDYDRDGNLDLLVVHYVDYVPGHWCEDGGGGQEFCGPSAFSGTVDRLFRSRGRFAPAEVPLFEDVTIAAGLAANPGKGLGAVCGDLTGDGRADFYVANDLEANHFWAQQSDGTFHDIALRNGTAFNQFGEAEAGMGIVSADLLGDAAYELFMTHLGGQTNTLYAREWDDLYGDRTSSSGLGPPSLPFTGFGVAAVDVENDGDLDVLVANGRVRRGPVLAKAPDDRFLRDYVEPNQLFVNDGRGRFHEAPALGGEFAAQLEVSRGLAAADFDTDGGVDFVLTNCAGPARLFENQAPDRGHWLLVRLAGRTADRDAIGADVRVVVADRELWRRQSPACGYLTSNDSRVHFGLGAAGSFASIVVRWPDGAEEEFPGGLADRLLTLVQGRGRLLHEPEQVPP